MLKLKHIPVKSFGENIAYIYKDCALYKVDDLNKVTKLEIHKGNKTIYAFLQIVAEEGVLAADEIGLNDDAFNTLNMSEGTEVHVVQGGKSVQPLHTFPSPQSRTLLDEDALLIPCDQPEIVGTAIRRGQPIEDVQQLPHLRRVIPCDEKGIFVQQSA